jgi:hypothetical protein
MLFLLFLGLLSPNPDANAVTVNLLTLKGSQTLKDWNPAELRQLTKKPGQDISCQEFFDQSTQGLELNSKADIDLITLYGANGKVARVPRFMIWRGFLKFQLGPGEVLNSKGDPNRLLVPRDFFSIDRIQKIEFSRASFTYPGTALSVRTNPAASRGEKLYTQSCLACHSIGSSPKIDQARLKDAFLRSFKQKHKAMGSIALDHRSVRGLAAYRDALASEKTVVKSSP